MIHTILTLVLIGFVLGSFVAIWMWVLGTREVGLLAAIVGFFMTFIPLMAGITSYIDWVKSPPAVVVPSNLHPMPPPVNVSYWQPKTVFSPGDETRDTIVSQLLADGYCVQIDAEFGHVRRIWREAPKQKMPRVDEQPTRMELAD